MTKEEAKDTVINYALGQKINNSINTMENLIDKIFDEHEAQLKAKDEEIELLKQCVEEAIKRPMGVEPNIYSDYKCLSCV